MAHSKAGRDGSPLSSIDSFQASSRPIPKFVHLEERFCCPVCKNVLVNAIQTSCGHRLCELCCQGLLEKNELATCPASDPDDPCDLIHKDQIFRDASARREIKQLRVYCLNKDYGCDKIMAWKDLQKHLIQCSYQTIECPNNHLGCRHIGLATEMDYHAVQNCLFRQITCRSCNKSILFQEERSHKQECLEIEIECPYNCGMKSILRKNLAKHEENCPKKIHECKFRSAGCQFMGTLEEVDLHIKSNNSEHLQLVTLYTGSMELKSMDIQTRLQEMTYKMNALQDEAVVKQTENLKLKKLVEKLEKSQKDMLFKQVELTERIIIQGLKVEELPPRQQIEQQARELQTMRDCTEQLQLQILTTESVRSIGKYGSLKNMADDFSTQLGAHESQIGIHNVRIAEMDLRFQVQETASYDGLLLWKIRGYARRKLEARNGRTLSLYSQPFYTSRYGYKMCARIYLNGDGMGKSTHISLFFVVMKGEYDALLEWPFNTKVNLFLLQQSSEKRHMSDHFLPDPNSSSFRKPVSEMNVASGCPLFASHAVVEDKDSCYLKDDTIFIKILVDTATIPHV